MKTNTNLSYEQMISLLAGMVTEYVSKHGVGRTLFPIIFTVKPNTKPRPQSTEKMVRTLVACNNFGLSFGPLEDEKAS
jgi:hypothetical protein